VSTAPFVINALSQTWDGFAGAVGAASGALIGLIFVAVSINRQRVDAYPALRAAAGQTLIISVLPLLLALEILIPDQSLLALGVEVLVTGVAQSVALIFLGQWMRRTSAPSHSRLSRLLHATSPTFLITVVVLVAGIILVTGHSGGLYWLVPAIALAWVGGTSNAWLFLVENHE
jgi:modulator of FtsH protease